METSSAALGPILTLSPEQLQQRLFADTYKACQTLRHVFEVIAGTRDALLPYAGVMLSSRTMTALNLKQCPKEVERWYELNFEPLWLPLLQAEAIPLATDDPTSRTAGALYSVLTTATGMITGLERRIYEDLLKHTPIW